MLVADGDAIARAEMAHALRNSGWPVLEACTGADALQQARDHAPALVVAEVELQGICGYELCHALRSELGDRLPVVFVSATRTEPHDRVAGFLIGADDYLVKPLALEELVARVRRLLQRSAPARTNQPLTERELEILGLLSQGLRQADIARKLFLSPKTIGTHTGQVFRKLGVHNRAGAVSQGYELGLLPLQAPPEIARDEVPSSAWSGASSG